MRFLKNLIVFLLVLIVIAIGVAFALPGGAHVERSITINRPASEVFTIVNSFRRLTEWSPWTIKDPTAKYTISGPAAGVGAKFAWVGDPNKVGSGSQEITESTPSTSVTSKLDFGDMGAAKARFVLTPDANNSTTKVLWTLDTDAPLAFDGKFVFNVIGRYMTLFMDKMVGPDYEQGLTRLKTLVETMPAADVSGVTGEETTLAAQKIYFISTSSTADFDSAKNAISQAYATLGEFIEKNHLERAGAPLSITSSYDATGWKFDAAVPVVSAHIAATGDIKMGSTYAGKAVQFTHVGPYDKIGETVTKAYAWLAVQGYKPQDRLIEEYVSDPGSTPPEKLQTRLKVPVQ